MMTSESVHETDIKHAARDWLLRTALEQPTPEEQAQLAQWSAADPRHEAAFRRFEGIWKDVESLQNLRELEPLEGRGKWFALHRPVWAWSAAAHLGASGWK